MDRPLLLIASRNASVAAALERYFSLFIPQSNLPHKVKKVGFSCSVELFGELDEIAPSQLRETMMLFDIGAEGDNTWDVKKITGEHGLVAQLVLSYPERYFVFLEASGKCNHPVLDLLLDQQNVARRHHFVTGGELINALELVCVHAQGFRTIFDSTGLRSVLKQSLYIQSGVRDVGVYGRLIQSRIDHNAASADEESPFVYLNGYVAYKAGFRTWLLRSESEYFGVLAKNAAILRTSPDKFEVFLSDWELVYPDHDGYPLQKSLLVYLGQDREPLEDSLLVRLDHRYTSEEHPCLSSEDFKAIEQLIIITSVQNESNKQSELCELYRHGFKSQKPYSGIHTLLIDRQEGNLYRLYAETRPIRGAGRVIQDNNNGYSKDQKALSIHVERLDGHSAPYAHSIIASRLLRRSNLIRATGAQDTETWVQMALLAGEAKEILGGMSRTAAYEAIALQNEAEVNAEVSFFGTAARITVKQRLDDLKRDAEAVQSKAESIGSRRYDTDNRAQLNFLLQTINNLRLRFSEYEQVEAAEECLSEFAELQRKLVPPKFRWILWYLDKATKAGTSVFRLIWVSLVVMIAFSCAYTYCLYKHPKPRTLIQAGSISGKQVSQQTQINNDGSPITGSHEATGCEVENDTTSQDGNVVLEYTYRDFLSLAKQATWHSFLTFLEFQPGLTDFELLKLHHDHGPDQFPCTETWIQSLRLITFAELGFAYLHLGLLVSLLYRRITKRAP
jgi:hypothetical protein